MFKLLFKNLHILPNFDSSLFAFLKECKKLFGLICFPKLWNNIDIPAWLAIALLDGSIMVPVSKVSGGGQDEK